ncbi:MAG: endonuclease/exonuclease/phosphatase family protein [Patescibacteria group bacterium]
MKLIQINIEFDKHLDLVNNLIKKENPDVVCMQEVLEGDFEKIKSIYNMHGVFNAMCINKDQKQGSAIFCKRKITTSNVEYYLKPTEEVLSDIKGETPMSGAHCSLLSVEIIHDDQIFNIITTHFPVHYPGSEVSDFQRECFKKMDAILKTKKDFILTGDTNCPRGTEIFDTLAKDYKDNVPQDSVTTIDEKLHRAGFLPYVVDCMFTTPEYKVTNIKLVDGVSDHLGIVAEIEKVIKN